MTSDVCAIKIRSIYMAIARYNKDGTVRKYRKKRKLRGFVTRTDIDTNVWTLTTRVDKRNVKGEIVATLDRSKGTVSASADKLVIHPHLVRRNYVVVGYDLDVRRTNTNPRSSQ